MKFQIKNFTTLFCFLMLLGSLGCNAQTSEHAGQKIKWMSFTQAVEANKKQPKKIFIDIYTGWCGWCKKMDATTFLNDTVANYMNEKFYAVKMDAENKDTIMFNDHQFFFMPEYKANSLALSLLNGKMSYPTFVVMDEKVQLLSPVAGYQTVPQIMPVLKYFGDNIYLNQNWTDYSNSLTPTKN
ncbi:MAG: DUF255 domain-containing protein [Bacteroidia bacterium]